MNLKLLFVLIFIVFLINKTINQNSPSIQSIFFDSFSTFKKLEKEYDYIIVGSGFMGVTALHELIKKHISANKDNNNLKKLKIVLIEKGPFLISDHFQNHPYVLKSLIKTCRAIPWVSKSSLDFNGMFHAIGGSSLFWSGWTPSPLNITKWPFKVDDIYFKQAKRLLEIKRAAKIFGENLLHKEISDLIWNNIEDLTTLKKKSSYYKNKKKKLDGMLSFSESNKRFSIVPLLFKSIKMAKKYPNLFSLNIITNLNVKQLIYSNNEKNENQNENKNDYFVKSILTSKGKIDIKKKAKIILGCSTIETTRLALTSFNSIQEFKPFIGANLQGHLHSTIHLRIKKNKLIKLLKKNENEKNPFKISCLLVAGKTKNDLEFQLQLTSSWKKPQLASKQISHGNLPDLWDVFIKKQDQNYIRFRIDALTEIQHHHDKKDGSYKKIELSENEFDDFGNKKAQLFLKLNKIEMKNWEDVENKMKDLIKVLAKAKSDNNNNKINEDEDEIEIDENKLDFVEFYNRKTKKFQKQFPKKSLIRNKLMVHESGSLFMIIDKKGYGKMKNFENLYFTGASIFPYCGSFNPVLTGVALTIRMIDNIY